MTFKPTVRCCDLMAYYCNNNQSTEVMTYSKQESMYWNYVKQTTLVLNKLPGNKKTNTMQRFVPSQKPMHWNYAKIMTSIS